MSYRHQATTLRVPPGTVLCGFCAGSCFEGASQCQWCLVRWDVGEGTPPDARVMTVRRDAAVHQVPPIPAPLALSGPAWWLVLVLVALGAALGIGAVGVAIQQGWVRPW